jgi:hypothetical protein
LDLSRTPAASYIRRACSVNLNFLNLDLSRYSHADNPRHDFFNSRIQARGIHSAPSDWKHCRSEEKHSVSDARNFLQVDQSPRYPSILCDRLARSVLGIVSSFLNVRVERHSVIVAIDTSWDSFLAMKIRELELAASRGRAEVKSETRPRPADRGTNASNPDNAIAPDGIANRPRWESSQSDVPSG